VVWDTVASSFRDAGGPDRVYVSRTLLNARRRREGHRRPVRTTAQHDEGLDAVFADRGFHVVHPETLDIDAQLATVASASVLAGLSGSGLHHSAFMPSGGRIVELGDGRSSDHPVPMQVAIDGALGHERCFLPGSMDPEDVSRALRRLGL
jgi:capsular polysaccharide biosynthesis protein